MRIVLLPGLDGTGILFKPFIKYAPANFDIEPVALDQNVGMSVGHQAQHVAKKLEGAPCILVAESYSGRIAYELALKHREKIKHIIFVASFLENPSFLSYAVSIMPAGLLRSRLLLKNIAQRIAFGRYETKELSDLLLSAINSAEPQVLKTRIKEISCMKTPIKKLDLPCTYLQASHDWLVSPAALSSFYALCPNLQHRVHEGSHFLMQTNPESVWSAINDIAL